MISLVFTCQVKFVTAIFFWLLFFRYEKIYPVKLKSKNLTFEFSCILCTSLWYQLYWIRKTKYLTALALHFKHPETQRAAISKSKHQFKVHLGLVFYYPASTSNPRRSRHRPIPTIVNNVRIVFTTVSAVLDNARENKPVWFSQDNWLLFVCEYAFVSTNMACKCDRRLFLRINFDTVVMWYVDNWIAMLL